MRVPYRRLSAFYFCYFGTLGAFLPFWSLFLRDSGFDSSEIGELSALLVATKIIAPNLWGWLADKTGKRLMLIRWTSLLSALLFTGFFYRQDFFCYALVTVSFSFFWNASLPQFEAATLFHLKSASHLYGPIRLWGSLGFVGAVLGIGRLLDDFSISYLPGVICSFLLLNWLIALTIPEAHADRQHGAKSGFWQIISKPEVWYFFVVYLLLQISHGPYYVFYSVFLEEYGYSAALTGQLWALGVCAEILLFLFASRLLRRVRLRTLLLISLTLTMLRWFVIANYIEQPLWIVSAQLLHAASFGLSHLVAIQLLLKYFGTSHLGIGQALYSSFSYGFGGMLGSLYSGYFWESIGHGEIFIIASLISGISLLLAFFGIVRTADGNQPG
jgi:MFS transporter, PPP family, 3-phenylpropionic acid transporter